MMGVYEIYSPPLVNVSPNWVRHSPGMGELVPPSAGVYLVPAGVYFPDPPVFASPTHMRTNYAARMKCVLTGAVVRKDLVSDMRR